MTISLKAVFLLAVLLLGFGTLTAQEDLGRESGLPSRIGGSRCDGAAPGARATVQGTFNVTGLQNSEKPPTFSVAIYAGGAFVSRQRVKNGGTFYFYCVPDRSVFISAEVNSTEIATYTVGSLDQPPQTNYQDIYLAWSAAKDEISLEFEGTGFVLRGESAKWGSNTDYVLRATLYIDDQPAVPINLPANFTTRRYELCWKYGLPKEHHRIRLKINNPSKEYEIRLQDAIVYSDKLLDGMANNY